MKVQREIRESIVCAAMILCVLILSTGAWAKSIEAKGSIEAVTVYRGQALVTRVVEIDEPRGSVELVVTELPARMSVRQW
jgi:hypothetical protein